MVNVKKWTALLLLLGLLASLLCGCLTTPETAGFPSQQDELTLLEEETSPSPAPAETSPSPAPAETSPSPAPVETSPSPAPAETSPSPAPAETAPDEDGSYTTKEDVCAYLIAYGHLPSNFITKSEAQAAGWEGGSLEKYCPGKCIGGDRFGNREGLLPKARGRTWTECDINTLGARSRGAERIVFSNDGLIYYTGDHYESFQLLYGEP